MQAPTESNKSENGSWLDNQTVDSLVDHVQGMNDSEKVVPTKAEPCDSFEHMDIRDGIDADNNLVESDGLKACSLDVVLEKAELGSIDFAEININGCPGDTVHGSRDEPKGWNCSIEKALDMDSRDGIGVDNSLLKSNGFKECSMDGLIKKGEGSSEINSDGHPGDLQTSHRNGMEPEGLNCSIEEGLEKVTLVGDGGLDVTESRTKKVGTLVVVEDNVSGSDSDSECETLSASSSSTSSSSSESDDDEGEDVEETLCKSKGETSLQTVDVEEGQILDSDAENMVSWSENNEGEVRDDDDKSDENSEEFEFEDAAADEDEDIMKGPIKSKNELEVLPPVPPVDVTLQPCHQILPVGVISSVLGAQVIVEGSEKHNPLNEGSILWIAESRLPLGLVDEIFGPVKTPYYIVRYNSESEVPSGIQNGTLVGFVPEFVGHVLNDKSLYQKGYDASGENDEEVMDEFDFSDDEKEAEYKRMLKMSKRGNNNQGPGPAGNKRKNNRNRDKTWAKDQPSTSQSPMNQSLQPSQMQQRGVPHVPSSSDGNHMGPSSTAPVVSGGPAVPSSSQGYPLGPSPMGPFFPNGTAAFPQQVQQAGFLLNGLLGNGIPFQQQNMALTNGFQMNSMPWMQQNHPQNLQLPLGAPTPWQQQQHVLHMPVMNPVPCQQPFDLSQLVAGATTTPFGSVNFAAGPTNWVGLLGQNLSNQGVGLQGPSSHLPMSPATVSNSLQVQSFNSQPPTGLRGNEGVSPQFSQGSSSGRGGRGHGRKPFNRRGGHFGGGRGRHNAN